MNNIAYIDTEIDPATEKILDIGCIKNDGTSFHNRSVNEFINFIGRVEFVCGHNILKHDLRYLKKVIGSEAINRFKAIDTLFLSPLLFPKKPYHALLKDDKLQTDEASNPLNDAIKSKQLMEDEITAFRFLNEEMKVIFYQLLANQFQFASFFDFIKYKTYHSNTQQLIEEKFRGEICEKVNIGKHIEENPIELAYSLSLINSFVESRNVHSITPRWVLRNYPAVEQITFKLRNTPCISGCGYCNKFLDPLKALHKYFGFAKYRNYGGVPLQEQAVTAAIANKSILAIFPTGGGKSITFQVPALMSAENCKGLTVVISPLQSLMKDQVDNLERNGIAEAATINGLLDPIERAKSFERIENGSASILYISPESLRSKTIERLILGRKIARFVIDEAHCFSSWGQDFRVDYLYIGDFIKSIEEKKNLEEPIPVSCFTATAKQKVVEDITEYFRDKLQLDLELFTSKASRTNLKYGVFERNDEEQKYQSVRDLIEEKQCPTIIYVSRTKKAYQLSERLVADGFNARPYHGKMDKQEKSENQDAFIKGEIDIMVATSAFGMGVDKKDVGMVIHYEISDSLENYVQEAGRAGRDEQIVADCFVLFNEEDLAKHFILLNQTKLSIKEIQQIWRAIKDITRFRSTISNSALEIARKAGWDDNVSEIETRVTTAIAALEDAGYIKRGQNMPRVFANSIMVKTATEAIDKINSSQHFQNNQKEKAVRIIKKLFSSKNKKQATEEVAESRVDYISDHLGIVKEEVINIINLLREERILADAKDLTAYIKRNENKNRSLNILTTYGKIEKFLLSQLSQEEQLYDVKELNEKIEEAGVFDVSTNKIKTVLNLLSIKNCIKRKNIAHKNHVALLLLEPSAVLIKKLGERLIISRFIVDFLYEKSQNNISPEDMAKDEILVEFSVQEIKKAYEASQNLFKVTIDVADVESALYYLSKIDAIKIEGGFLVVYNRITIERTEQNNKKQYTKEDYQKLHQFYENKVQQIHIVGEYAKKMISDYRDALQFVEDYFQLNYTSFLNKYFKGSRQNEIKRNITPSKFRQLFGELSPTQLKIITDNESKNIVVAAGPGSGKTRVLVHKLASLLLMEDVKHEQLLMVTFSRAAAIEFKKRLLQLIGNAANFIEIKTFHSYCFDLMGKVGSLEKSTDILRKSVQKIKTNEVETSQITKTVLVIDEAQDMDADEYQLIQALMAHNEEMRVIAVGDDDQNIYKFRGASSVYLEHFVSENGAVRYDLLENYRSKNNIVDFANQFAKLISRRLKQVPIISNQNDDGQIKIVKYESKNLISPLVTAILSTEISGTTCVLTKTNEEALQITGLLIKNKLPAKLIQTNDGFNLYNLVEVRYFLNKLELENDIYWIDDDKWLGAKRSVFDKYRQSTKFEILTNIVKDFEATNPKRKYKSDLKTFILESKLEDFFGENGEVIFVSTIHKAKGREFDNVFMLLEDFDASSDEAKRLLYVAITRAKTNLAIHLNGNFIDNIAVANLLKTEIAEQYLPPNQIALQLTLKDVWLDYFANRQHLVDQLVSGHTLKICEDGCLDANGRAVIKFSKQFLVRLDELKKKNYQLKTALVNFVVFWKKEGNEQEIKIVLPELHFEKTTV